MRALLQELGDGSGAATLADDLRAAGNRLAERGDAGAGSDHRDGVATPHRARRAVAATIARASPMPPRSRPNAEFCDARADRVSLLTLHAAKGLEFAVVFIVGLEDGLLPLHWGEPDDAAMAEERRLFYVGMTRAKDRLILSRARQRHWRGRTAACSNPRRSCATSKTSW